MKLWRLLVDGAGAPWNVVVSASDPFEAWELARSALPVGLRAGACLEELEALHEPAPPRTGVVLSWRGGARPPDATIVKLRRPRRRK